MDTEQNPAAIFPDTYEESRERFIGSLEQVRAKFPGARHVSHTLSSDADLSIDWITYTPEKLEKAIILTTGLHGIEGYTGAVMMQLFVREYLPELNPETTGLLLVHAINPYGMKYRRKVNGNNVDLNRNFTMHLHEHDPHSNPAARRLKNLVYPERSLNAGFFHRAWFLLRVLAGVARTGQKDFMAGALMGQYCFPQGMYFGGEGRQEETLVMMDLLRFTMESYPQVLMLDMHTGYGPSRQMSLVNSTREPDPSTRLSERFAYPLVQKTDAGEFYAMNGDMVDYAYRLREEMANIDRFYACSFEFGTYGDSVVAGLCSLSTMVFEMQARRFGAVNESSRAWIEEQFNALYDVRDAQWVEKAIKDACQAFSGILTAEGFITQSSAGNNPDIFAG